MIDNLKLQLLGETGPPDKNKVAFVHINKTGGTSVLKALGLGKKEHLTIVELKKLMGASWDEAYKFAFVRNPWDKVVSHYKYRVKTNQTNLQTDNINFANWVRFAYEDKSPKYHDIPKMFLPQVDWLKNEQGNIEVDFIGRFENISADFCKVSKALGVRRNLTHENKTPKSKHFTDFYDQQSRIIIEKYFREDIDYFDYKF